MVELDETSRVVYNFEDFADAVVDENINTIYFGADIELMDSVTIPADKPSLVFDGTFEEVTHRFTDMNSRSLEDTIAVRLTSRISLTFQNMNMTGRNFYGIPCIYETFTSDVLVTYRNITYVGPQLVHNPMGLTRFENCDITILPSDMSEAQEVGEVCRVEFAGENTIWHNSETWSSNAAFFFRGTIGTAYFKVLAGSTLTVNTANYFMYNAIVIVQYPVAYEIEPGASFTLNSHHGISHDSLHWASSFLVDTGASFRYIQETNNNNNVASINIRDSFIINEGANVYMQADFDNAQPLINFAQGMNNSFIINNPENCVLYNRSNEPVTVATLVSSNYSIRGGQLNHWIMPLPFPEAGGFDDEPQNKWINTNQSIFTVSGSITASTTTATGSGLIGPQPDLINFNFQNARVLSVGNLPLVSDTIVDNGRPITGLTKPGAEVLITFTAESRDYTFRITADTDGRFLVDPEMPIPEGTTVTIKANQPFLLTIVQPTVVAAGEITIIKAPERIAFGMPPISTNPVLLRRDNPEEPVEINDSRQYRTQWTLSVSITGPLETASGEVLEKAVVFKDDDGDLRELGSDPIIIYTGEPVAGQTNVFWTEEKGILVRVTDPIRSGVRYSNQLIWELETIPEP